MKPIWESLLRNRQALVIPLSVLFAMMVTGWFVRRYLFGVLERWPGRSIRHYGRGVASALPVTTLTQNLASSVVAAIGILILLNALGIPVTPILTALGVGGLAVAVALQNGSHVVEEAGARHWEGRVR